MLTQEDVMTDPQKLELQISEQLHVNADISNHKPDLDDIVVTGHELIKHCQGEDVPKLQSKLEGNGYFCY